MPQNAKSARKSKELSRFIFHIIILLFGVVVGVISCNWSYFKFQYEIKVNDIVSMIVTSGVAVYIGANIQKAIARNQHNHEVLADEVKRILVNNERLETWLDNRTLPFDEAKKFFKKTTIAISICQQIFSSNSESDAREIATLVNSFNRLKQGILSGSPVSGNIHLTQQEADQYETSFSEIRIQLLGLLI